MRMGYPFKRSVLLLVNMPKLRSMRAASVTGAPKTAQARHPLSPCFTPGTLIKTEFGEIPVQDIGIGTRVLTRDNGYQKVIWCGQRHFTIQDVENEPQLQPIRIAAGALGPNLPSQELEVSPHHRMLLSNQQIRDWFDADEVLIAARLLSCFQGVTTAPLQETCFIHFMFDQHEIVLANGTWTESYQPQDMRLGVMDAGHRAELLRIFPELEELAPEGYPAARPVVSDAAAERWQNALFG
jgi:hypothetical protein